MFLLPSLALCTDNFDKLDQYPFKIIVNNMWRSLILIAFFSLEAFLATATSDPNKRYTRSEYIAQWKDVAMEQMEQYGIPASITLAQAILESGDGNSELARGANNHFGIKCHGWEGKKVYHDDDKKNECFRKYKNARESFKDHSLFLQRNRYQFLFDYDVTDYKSWAKGLKKAGYATNPKYPALLIRLIEENNLDQYDKPGKKRRKSTPPPVAKKPTSSSGEIVVNMQSNLAVQKSSNQIRYVVADRNYSARDLAQKFEMGDWQIKKYNDLEDGEQIQKGQLVYLQPKRGKNKKYNHHIVKEGETLRDISQKYGVKISKILKHSELPKNYQIKTGDKLSLN